MTAEYQNLKSTKTTLELKRSNRQRRDHQWSSKYSKKSGSAEFHAKVDTETHECINITTSQNIEDFRATLNRINVDTNKEIQQRIEKITKEEQLIVNNILEERQTSEEVVLQKTKLEQEKLEESYQALLQEYIHRLEREKIK